jgi:hypothetical protein
MRGPLGVRERQRRHGIAPMINIVVPAVLIGLVNQTFDIERGVEGR